MKKSLFSAITLATILFVSCDKEDVNPTVVPATYAFERNGSTTVDFNGQTTRIKMADELAGVLKTPTKTEEDLDGMFTNTGNKFSDAALNASTKSIRSKTAASTDYFSANTTDAAAIKADFDTWIAAQVDEVYPNWNTDANVGVAGKIQEAGGGSERWVNAKGLEYDQVIVKGLIGALMVDQMLNNYLSTAVLDEGTNKADNDADIVIDIVADIVTHIVAGVVSDIFGNIFVVVVHLLMLLLKLLLMLVLRLLLRLLLTLLLMEGDQKFKSHNAITNF